MKVAVIGATGGVGRLVVDAAIARGHHVVAVSRSPAPTREGSFERHAGDVTDAAFLRGAIAGCDAVISCLGQRRVSAGLFARRTSPADVLRRAAAATIEAAPRHLIYLSAFGVGEDRRHHALLFRIILRLSSIHDAYLDHAEAEGAIKRSAVPWTIVRPPGLTDKDEEVPLIDRGDRWSSFETVSKRSLAAFLVSRAEEGPLSRTITIGAAARG